MKKATLACLFFVLSISLVQSQNNNIHVKIAGASGLVSLWDEIQFSYKPLRPDVNVSFTSVNSFDTSGVLSGRNHFLSNTEDSVTSSSSGGINFYPVFLSPLAIYARLPGVTGPILLDTDTLVEIYLGRVNKWLDPRIVAMNPHLPDIITNLTIVPILLGSAYSPITKLSAYFSTVHAEWNETYGYIADGNWPQSLRFPNFKILSGGAFTVVSNSHLTNGSIAMAPYSYLNSIDILKSLNLIKVYDPVKNKTFEPTLESADLLVKAIDKLELFRAPIGDYWSINSLYYLGVLSNPMVDCKNLTEAYLFLRWFLSSKEVRTSLQSDLVVFLSEEHIDKVLQDLKKIRCNGVLLLAENIQDDPQQAAEIVILVLGFCVLIIIWIAQLYLHSQDVISKIAKIYHILLLTGSTVSYFSLIFWFIQPKETWICQFRIWFLFLGISLLLGTVFSRSLQLKKIQKMIEDGKVKKTLNHNLIVSVSISVVVGLQIIFLIIWTSVDMFVAGTYIINDLKYESARNCSSNDTFLWLGIQALYFGILLFWGIYVVYITWNIHSSVDDSRLLVMSIYTTMMSLCISVAIIGFALKNDRQFFWWALIFVTVVTLSLTGSIYIPKLLEVRSSKSQSKKSSSKHVVVNVKTHELEIR